MYIVYGGSFNPPTIAHLNIIKKCLSIYQDAKIILLPASSAYDKTGMVSYNHRKHMLMHMIKGLDDRVFISDLEEKTGFIGTYHLLNILNETHKDLYFVMGSDQLNVLNTWIEYKDLLKNYKIIIINRHHNLDQKRVEMMFKDIEHHFEFIDFDMAVSSSEIRADIKNHQNELDTDVYQYILKHHLYEGGSHV